MLSRASAVTSCTLAKLVDGFLIVSGHTRVQWRVSIRTPATRGVGSPWPNTSISLKATNKNLDLLVTWFRKNYLAISHSKSQSIVFNRATLPMPFVIDSNELDYVTQIKLLGVIIDNSLSFKAHIQEICRKVNAKVSEFSVAFENLYLQVL